jgi:hypothetical protein
MPKKIVRLITFLGLVNILLLIPAAVAADVTTSQFGQMARNTLAALGSAYEQEDLQRFMKLVSPDFTGDDFLLYRAVRRDFRFFDNIDLRLNVDSIAIDPKGRAQLTVKYNRSVIANKDGRSYKDSGLTQMTFNLEEGQAKLYDMKFPLIFGLSEGLQIATGLVRTMESVNVLTLDRSGNVNVQPFNDALNVANGNSVIQGMVTLTSTSNSIQGFSMAERRKIISAADLQGDFGWFPWEPCLLLQNGTKYTQLSDWSFNRITEAPDPTVTVYETFTATSFVLVAVGQTFALQLAGSNKFAIIEIESCSSNPAVENTSGTFRYKYQPSGSRSF